MAAWATRLGLGPPARPTVLAAGRDRPGNRPADRFGAGHHHFCGQVVGSGPHAPGVDQHLRAAQAGEPLVHHPRRPGRAQAQDHFGLPSHGQRVRSRASAAATAPGRRHPLGGLASTGQPVAWASCQTAPGLPAPAPATIRPRSPAPASRSTTASGRRELMRPCHPVPGGAAGPALVSGQERLARPDEGLPESQVQVYRSWPVRPAPGLGHGPGSQRTPRPRRLGLGHARGALPAHGVAVQADLVHGLGRPPVLELSGTVGGHRQHGHPGVVGLDYGRVKLDGGRAAGGHHRRRHPRGQA